MILTINDIKSIAAQLQQRLGIEYTSFALSFFRRRLMNAVEKLNIHRQQEIADMLTSMVKLDEIAYRLSVPCTEMFRDPAFWRALRKHLGTVDKPTIWLPNVTNGYELFSLMILLRQIKKVDAKIKVNCVSEKIVAEIKSLVYPTKADEINRSNFERLEWTDSFDDYVHKEDDGRQLFDASLLEGVDIRVGWFMNQPVEKYDVIVFRNQLLEFTVPMHEKAVTRLCESMNDGGILAIGIKEKLLVKVPMISVVNESENIYGRNIKRI